MRATVAPGVTVLGRDAVGVVAESEGMRYYLTECCGASATGTSGGTACRGCYRLIDSALGGMPDQRMQWTADGSDFEFVTVPVEWVEVYGDGIPFDVWQARR